MEQKTLPLIYFEGETKTYFFGIVAEHLGEEDFGLFFKYSKNKWIVKGTWEDEWRTVSTEEFHEEIKDIYKTIEELEKDRILQEQADREAEESLE